jgi:protein-S-isoprenylcysteine O-methyltransferase Ste14
VSSVAVRNARRWFAVQAASGILWWIAVAASDDVRRATLGSWDPVVLAGPDLILFVGGSLVAAATGSRRAAALTAGWTVGITAACGASALLTGEGGWGAAAMVLASLGTAPAAAALWWGHLPTSWFFQGPFRFEVADERSPGRHLARSLVQLVVFWSTFFLAVPAVLVWAEDRAGIAWPTLGEQPWPALGAGAFALASVVGLWSCATMATVGLGTPLPAATARRLVVRGPYRFVRNPMAVAGAIQTIGVGMWAGSWTVVLAGATGAVAWHLLIRPMEEADLLERFGASYEQYRAQVRCWVPRRSAHAEPEIA